MLLKNLDTKTAVIIHPKIWIVWFYQQSWDGMANNADPAQNAPAVWKGSALFAQTYPITQGCYNIHHRFFF